MYPSHHQHDQGTPFRSECLYISAKEGYYFPLNYQAKLKKKDELKAPAPSSAEETEIINAITYDISTSIHELSSARKNMNFL